MKGWNYRIATYVSRYPKLNDERLFKIITVYYDDEGKPNSYGEGKTDSLDGFDIIEDLFSTLLLMQKAIEKPILDIDNWPNVWIGDDVPEDIFSKHKGSSFFPPNIHNLNDNKKK